MESDRTILIVEDGKLNAKFLKNILNELDYKIKTAENGKEAIKIISREKPELILLDIILPDFNGLDICRMLKSDKSTKDIPIIFISSLDNSEQIAQGFRAGAVDYIPKPFRREVVLARVKTHLKLFEVQKELKQKNKQQDILLENIDTHVWYLKDELRYGKVNNSHAEFMGVDKSEIEDRRLDELLNEEEAEVCIANNLKLFNEAVKVKSREWAENYKGEKRLLKIIKTPVFDEKDNIEYVVASADDITEQWKQEEEIKRQREKLKKIIETTIDGFFILNKNGKFLKVNQSLINILEYSEAEILNMNIRDIELNENSDEIRSHLIKIAEKGSERFTTRYTAESGEVRFVEISVKYLEEEEQYFTFVRDITEQRQKNKKLEESEKKFRNYINNSPIGVFVIDQNREFCEVNEAACKLTEYSESELIGSKVWRIHKEVDSEDALKALKKLKLDGSVKGEIPIFSKNNQEKIITVNAVELSDGRVLAFAEDITEKKKQEEKIRFLSFHDKLTGLYNRRYLENEMERLADSRHYPLSIIVGDIDNLKYINDNYGHKMGDYYINKSAEVFKDVFRTEDIISRTGGDEFTILLPETDELDMHRILKRIKNRFNSLNSSTKELPVPLNVSLGYSVVEKKEEKIGFHYKIADQKMYRNKEEKYKYN